MVAREKAIRRILVPVPLHLVNPPARTVATFASHLLAKRQGRAAVFVGLATPDADLLNEICRCRGPKARSDAKCNENPKPAPRPEHPCRPFIAAAGRD